ncbi:MAG: hydrolase [Thermodesulfovibrionia bacterium]|nr:hydrolase [Thermodesulfovibrionia bacterium]MCK5426237.1 hydrolase [Thermodesulfovibrionia bacterium]
MTRHVLHRKHLGFAIIDVQIKLMAVMSRRQRIVENSVKLIHLARLFNLPVIVTEHYPRMMGSTLPEIKEALHTYDPIEKMDFNCCAVESFNNRLKSADLETILLAGVETHICIFQTCLNLLEKGYNVHVPHDAVDSRTEENWHIGLDLMKDAGAVITSTETIIFQILKRAGTKEFKEMLRIIK